MRFRSSRDPEGVGHLGAVGRDRRLTPRRRAPRARRARGASRCGQGSALPTTARRVTSSRSIETTRRSSSIHTGLDALSSLRGGPPAVGTSQTCSLSTYATVLPSGDMRGSSSSQKGIGSRPVVRRSGAAGLVEVEQPDVRGVAVLDEDGPAAVGADRERARPRRGRHRLEPPVRRRLQVLARLGRHALVLVLADPDRTVLRHSRPPRIRPAPRAPGRRSCPGRSRPPARTTVGSPSAPSVRPAARKPVGGDLERALGIAAGGVHAEGDDERPRASARAPTRRAPPTAASQSSSPLPGRERQVAVGARRPVSSAKPEVVREPAGAGVHVDRAGEHVARRRGRSPGCRCRGGRRCRSRRPGRRPRAGGRRRRPSCSGSTSRRSRCA